MPPAIFVAVSSAEGALAAESIELTVSSSARPGDTLILLTATPIADGLIDEESLEADGWENILEHTGNTHYLWAFRREVVAGEVSEIVAPFLAPFTATALGALAVYRNLNNGATVIGATGSTRNATANFVCPSQTLTRYSDLYLGIAVVETDDETVTPPAGGTERLDYQAGAMTLALFDVLLEAAGATGTKTIVVAAAEDGIAASIALSANPLIGFGKSFTVEPIGAIGLPSRGV